MVSDLPRMTSSRGSQGSRPTSRAPSVSRGESDDENEGLNPPLSSRGVEEHRCDPALRVALERLDAVRHSQPSFDDFALENFYVGSASPAEEEEPTLQSGSGSARLSRSRRSAAGRGRGRGRGAGGSGYGSDVPRAPGRGLQNCFSLDLLMAALAPPPAVQRGNVPWAVGSRSTSPGSTCQSSTTSGSVGSIGSVAKEVPRQGAAHPAVAPNEGGRGRIPLGAYQRQPSSRREVPREPAPPAGAPPRRPARQRVLSARSRQVEAAVDSSAAELGMYSAR